jgi:sec-independent protein translocase protein TatC
MDTKLIKPPDTDVTPDKPPDKPQDTPEEGGPVMSLLEHIEELRTRLLRAVIGIAVGMGIALLFTNPVLNYLKDAYGDRLLIIDPTESVVVFFRVCLMLGAILASPYITYQLFMFVLPGLTRKEKRWIFLALPATTTLFLVGIVFTWSFLVPTYVNFLEGFQSDVFKVNWTADNYIGFVTAVLFWHGAAFETPLIFFVLGRFGAVTAASMLSYWRHAVVGTAVIAAFITPTVDPLTMLVIMVILIALYGLSVVLVGISTGFRRQPLRRL